MGPSVAKVRCRSLNYFSQCTTLFSEHTSTFRGGCRYGRMPALQSFSGSLDEQGELEEDVDDADLPAENDPFVPPPSYEEAQARVSRCELLFIPREARETTRVTSRPRQTRITAPYWSPVHEGVCVTYRFLHAMAFQINRKFIYYKTQRLRFSL